MSHLIANHLQVWSVYLCCRIVPLELLSDFNNRLRLWNNDVRIEYGIGWLKNIKISKEISFQFQHYITIWIAEQQSKQDEKLLLFFIWL